MRRCQSWVIVWFGFIGLACLPTSNSIAQVFSERLLGPPRDPVITRPSTVQPPPQVLPTPRPTPSQTIRPATRSVLSTPSDNEPLSLSDSTRPPRVVSIESSTPLSLDHQVWQRMLDLERENAELVATLDYERKLTEYQQRTDGVRDKLIQEITALRAQIENDRAGQRNQLEQVELRMNRLQAERDELQTVLESTRQEMTVLEKNFRREGERFEKEREEWQKSREREAKQYEKLLLPDEDRDASLPSATQDNVSAATGGVQILVHQASWIDE